MSPFEALAAAVIGLKALGLAADLATDTAAPAGRQEVRRQAEMCDRVDRELRYRVHPDHPCHLTDTNRRDP